MARRRNRNAWTLLLRCSDQSETNSFATIEITEQLILSLLRRQDKLLELQKEDRELSSMRYSLWLAEFFTCAAMDHLDEQPYRQEAEAPLLSELEWGETVLLSTMDVYILERLRDRDEFGLHGARTECDAAAVYDNTVYAQAYLKHSGSMLEADGLERQKLLELLRQIEIFDTD